MLRDDEIADVMDELPLENRMVVYFADVEGLRYREIATLMNTPVGTVMSRLHRGRRRLRELLADTAKNAGWADGHCQAALRDSQTRPLLSTTSRTAWVAC